MSYPTATRERFCMIYLITTIITLLPLLYPSVYLYHICVYTHIYIDTYYTHTYIYIYTRTRIHIHAYICAHVAGGHKLHFKLHLYSHNTSHTHTRTHTHATKRTHKHTYVHRYKAQLTIDLILAACAYTPPAIARDAQQQLTSAARAPNLFYEPYRPSRVNFL